MAPPSLPQKRSRWLNLLLLFCFINVSESPAVGNSLISVTGNKGGNVTLQCKSQTREITDIVLNRQSNKILVCENEECKSENSRVFKEGSCDVIIKDLSCSDAGKYFLRVRYTNDQTEVERRGYHLHIHDEISVKKGEDLKLDVLLINADKVERSSSSDWEKIWTRDDGVNSDRLTVSNETLIINEFTDTDTGTYRVLDSNNETLITVTVTESRTDSDSPGDCKDDTEPPPGYWFWCVGLPVLLLALVGVIVFVIKKPQCLMRLYFSPPDQNSEKPGLQ